MIEDLKNVWKVYKVNSFNSIQFYFSKVRLRDLV